MSADSIVEQMPGLQNFTPEQLIIYLFDWLESHPNYVIDIANVWIITQILNTLVFRNITKPYKPQKELFVHDKK